MWAFVSKVMSLLFNMLFRFVITFFPKGLPWWLRPKEQASFNFMAAVTICSDFGAPPNKICHCFHCSPPICREVMGQAAMILDFWWTMYFTVYIN